MNSFYGITAFTRPGDSSGLTLIFDTAYLQAMISQRLRRSYFLNTYAEPRDLFDLRRPLADDPSLPIRANALWHTLIERLKVLVGHGAWLESPASIRFSPARRLEGDALRLFLKNLRDFLLHSAAGEILVTVHPLMSERAFALALKTLQRALARAFPDLAD